MCNENQDEESLEVSPTAKSPHLRGYPVWLDLMADYDKLYSASYNQGGEFI